MLLRPKTAILEHHTKTKHGAEVTPITTSVVREAKGLAQA